MTKRLPGHACPGAEDESAARRTFFLFSPLSPNRATTRESLENPNKLGSIFYTIIIVSTPEKSHLDVLFRLKEKRQNKLAT